MSSISFVDILVSLRKQNKTKTRALRSLVSWMVLSFVILSVCCFGEGGGVRNSEKKGKNIIIMIKNKTIDIVKQGSRRS